MADRVARIEISLHGSLAFTGKGHATDSAVLLGLTGLEPETIHPDAVEPALREIHSRRALDVPEVGVMPFDPDSDLRFDMTKELPRHTNGMRFVATDEKGEAVATADYYSLGGGFIVRGD